MRLKIMIGVLALAAALGCSKSGPVTPDVARPQTGSGVAQQNCSMLWGLYNFTIDRKTGDVEVVPLRGVEFTANVLRFMQPPKSAKNLVLGKAMPPSDFTTGHLFVKVTLKHPFPGNATFTGFDVRGVIIGNGTVPGIADPSIMYAGENDLRVENADGYTRWFNPTEFTTYDTLFGYTKGVGGTPKSDWTAILNGYKYYCDDLGQDDDLTAFFSDPSCPNPRGMFSDGSTLARTFELQFPMNSGSPDISFQYAVIGSWVLPDPNPPVNIPGDFPTSANCQEAYCLSIADQSQLYYVDPTTKGGTLDVLLKVFDHQGAGTSAGVAGEVSMIHLETPGGIIANGGLASFDSSALAGALIKQDDVSATWDLKVTDTSPSATGQFPIVVVVESANPTTYFSGIPGFAYPANAPLAAYQLGWVTVTDQAPDNGQPPVAVAEIVSTPPLCPGTPIDFSGSDSYAEGGKTIVKWEWDFEGDGQFDDAVGSTAQWTYNDIGIYHVQLRVTDSKGLTDTLDTPLEVLSGSPTWVDVNAEPLLADGSFEHPYVAINDGISLANKGCSQSKWVLVKAGTYQEHIKLIDNLTLEGYSTPAPLLTTEEALLTHMVVFGGANNATLRHFRAEPKCVNDYSTNQVTDGIWLGMGR